MDVSTTTTTDASGNIIYTSYPQFLDPPTPTLEPQIRPLSELRLKDAPQYGGKAANLGELISIAMPVPYGIALSTAIHDQAMQSSNAVRTLRNALAGLIDPEKIYAVRSSSPLEDSEEHSFAGQFLTKLGVNYDSIGYAVIGLYKHVASSQARLGSLPYIGVIIQEMPEVTRAGVIFTIDPTNNDPNVAVIECVLGLGEGLVSGSLTPDLYLYRKSTGREIAAEIVSQPYRLRVSPRGTYTTHCKTKQSSLRKLSKLAARRLLSLALTIEAHYGYPVDVEWCMSGAQIFILQARPVTSWKKSPLVQQSEQQEIPAITPPTDMVLAWKGLPVSSGVATGRLHTNYETLTPGDILVAAQTSPEYVSYMTKATAIITETGGITCHAAIVSRELDIPCVTGIRNLNLDRLSEMIKDRNIVAFVDGYGGKVYLHSEDRDLLLS